MSDMLELWSRHVNSVYKLLISLLTVFIVGVGVGYYARFLLAPVSSCVSIEPGDGGLNIMTDDVNKIVVDLSGAVVAPGVYTLNEGDRVVDVLQAGGGILGDISRLWVSEKLNLAEPLTDGIKVYVPFEWDLPGNAGATVDEIACQSGTEGSGNTDGATKVNVNTASASELEKLPGIGPVYAKAIIDSRKHANIDDMKAKAKLPQSVITKLDGLIEF